LSNIKSPNQSITLVRFSATRVFHLKWTVMWRSRLSCPI